MHVVLYVRMLEFNNEQWRRNSGALPRRARSHESPERKPIPACRNFGNDVAANRREVTLLHLHTHIIIDQEYN